MRAADAERPARTTISQRRPRNAGASKQALLNAAQRLFGQDGFERTTIRDIGELAGVDHALIARYFGSKADLYIAAVVAEAVGDQPRQYEGLEDMAEALVVRMDEHGLGPVMQALIRSDTSDQIREAAQAHVARRMVDPMVSDMTSRGVEGAQLRSEIVVSALLGVLIGRALGWFDELKGVPRARLVGLVTDLLLQE